MSVPQRPKEAKASDGNGLTSRLRAFAGNNDQSSEPAGHVDETVEYGRCATGDKALVIFID